MPYDLLTLPDVQVQYGISPSALDRMVREGLIVYIREDNTPHVRSDQLDNIVRAAAALPSLLTCECAGPCDCQLS